MFKHMLQKCFDKTPTLLDATTMAKATTTTTTKDISFQHTMTMMR
jgi:hypothetical protein